MVIRSRAVAGRYSQIFPASVHVLWDDKEQTLPPYLHLLMPKGKGSDKRIERFLASALRSDEKKKAEKITFENNFK